MPRDALAPIVVFAYNRPQHLQRALDALAACRLAAQSHLYAFADGPRRPEAAVAVAQVRQVLERERNAGRFAGFTVQTSEINRGLANSIISGVGQVIAEYGRVIVLEDDLLMTPDFLEFMNDSLAYYKDDVSVGSVTGFCPIKVLPEGTGDVFLVERSCSQGWGTWTRVWSEVDWAADASKILHANWRLRRAFNREGNDQYARLRRQLAGRIDSWSIRFGLSLFVRGLGTVYPAVSRIVNIGYDGTGVHCGVGTPTNEAMSEAPYTLQPLRIDPRIQRAFHRVYSGKSRGRWLRELLAVSPRLAGLLGR